MRGSRGFAYEEHIYNILKESKKVPHDFTPAGSDANAPDCIFLHKGKKYKLELKVDLRADFGQGSLSYKDGKWFLSGSNTPEAKEMRKLLKSVKIEEITNEKWGSFGIPKKFKIPLKKFTESDVEEDYRRFKEFFVKIDTDSVAKYYNSKDTYYIQIGKLGLYHLGRDPAELGTPEFSPDISTRVRIKRSGSKPIYNYRFAAALKIKKKPEFSRLSMENPVFLI